MTAGETGEQTPCGRGAPELCRPPRPAARIRAIGATLLLAACSVPAAPPVATRLAPGLPAVETAGIPPLYTARDAIPDADVADPGLRLVPPSPHRWVCDPGDAFVLTVAADATEERESKAILSIWDWEGRPIHVREFETPARAEVRLTFEGRGTYLLVLDRRTEGQTAARCVRSVCAAPSNSAKIPVWLAENGVFIGTCAYPERMHWGNAFGNRYPPDMTGTEAAELEAELSARLGVQAVRLHAGPAEGVPLYERFGIRPFLQVDTRPPGNVPLLPKYEHVAEARWRYPVPEAVAMPHYQEMFRRFADKAILFEVANEADNDDFWRGTPEEYIETAARAAELARQYAPNVPACASGWTLIKPDVTRTCLTALKDAFPCVSVHAHGDFRQARDQLDAFEALLDETGNAQAGKVQTEMGFCHWRLDMDAYSAASRIRKILLHMARGYKGVVLYRTRDQGGPRLAGDTQGMWGYLDHDFCPRFNYGAVAALIDTLAGMRFESAPVSTADLCVYVFAGETGKVVTIFRADPREANPPPVTVLTDARSAELIDAMGNPRPVEKPETIEVVPGFYPTFVRLPPATSVRIAKPTTPANP